MLKFNVIKLFKKISSYEMLVHVLKYKYY